MKKDFFIHDIEIYNDMSFAIYKKVKEDKIIYFDLVKDKSKHKAFFEKNFLIDKNYLVGFNNWSFDIPVIITFNEINTNTIDRLKEIVSFIIDLPRDWSYKKVIIETFNKFMKKDKSRFLYKHYISSLNVIDLYKMNKWDDDSRRASLKWIAANMNSSNIKETPYDFNDNIKDSEQKIQECIEYCINDVYETEKILIRNREDIKMRIELNNLLNEGKVPNSFLSLSNTAIGSKIILDEIVKIKNKSIKQIKAEAKKVEYIFDTWKDIIFDNVKEYLTNNRELHNILKSFTNGILHRNKEYSIEFKFENTLTKETFSDIKLAKGGGHGLLSPGMVYSSSDTIILDFDVASYYPSIVLSYGLFPRNIGEEFKEVYKNIRDKRFKYPKGHALNKAYKDALNSIVGLSNMNASVFFDPSFFFKVTINGQLMLTILIYELSKNIRLDLIQLNTDGATIKLLKEDRGKAERIFDWWQRTFMISLEFVEYRKMLLEHVNSYIAEYKIADYSDDIYDKGIEYVNPKTREVFKLKCKGSFVFDDNDIELHKNNSARIIPKAIANYYFKGIPVTETILSEENIELFLCYQRINSDTELLYINAEDYLKGAGLDIAKIFKHKVIRYVYTNVKDNAVVIFRSSSSGAKILDKESKFVYICNDIRDKENIKRMIDRKQYIMKANQLISKINVNTNNMFNLFNL
ncbi:MAG: hypothetical protein KatS3mg002_1333 [Candidatus Woesearchaeota archaeon]|nr:MAG: hypothetical protein KatS3mg002_1333 [Candidatus Woesearchaeota archaeon]